MKTAITATVVAFSSIGCFAAPNDTKTAAQEVDSSASGQCTTYAYGVSDGSGSTCGHGGGTSSAVFSVAAGSGGHVGESYAASGPRLKVVWYVSDDGFHVFSGDVHDSALGFDCTITTDANGDLRCFPKTLVGSMYYIDAACTVTAILIGDRECDPRVGRYASSISFGSSPGSCASSSYRLYDIGTERYAVGYQLSGSVCTRQSHGGYMFAPAVEADPAVLAHVVRTVGDP